MKRTVIVTGGAKGIGKNIVETLAQKGFNVVLNYNTSEKEAVEIKEKLKEKNIDIDIFKADVSNREEVKKLVLFTIEKYTNIDILINNAGISQIKLFTDINDKDWNKMIQTNLNSAFYMIQETAQNMIHNKNGCIINISSIWGITGASCESHYSVTKAGMDGLTKSLAKEFGPSNIRVNSIAPGIIDTDMNKNITEQEKEQIRNEIPLERIGKPENITKCVEWLIEDDYVTGQVISVNGGWLIS